MQRRQFNYSIISWAVKVFTVQPVQVNSKSPSAEWTANARSVLNFFLDVNLLSIHRNYTLCKFVILIIATANTVNKKVGCTLKIEWFNKLNLVICVAFSNSLWTT
jgi:hypothetical protein